MCSLINIIFVSITLIPLINSDDDTLLIDNNSVSLYAHSEKQILFRSSNDFNMNTEWCLFYNVDDFSNHLYCVSTVSSPYTTECHSIIDDRHYTFTNISLCDSHKLPHIDISSTLPILGTFNDDAYICLIYKQLCCKLNTENCFIDNGNNDVQTNDNQVLIIPFTDGFLEFTLDTLSISCIDTNKHITKCDLLPSLWTPPNTMVLFDAVFLSSTSILFLFTDAMRSILYIQQCTIFTRDSACNVLSEVSISDTNTVDIDSDIEMTVIGHNECIVLLHMLSDHDISYILIYNYCQNQIQQIDTEQIDNDNNDIIHNVLNNYIANYGITNFDEYISEVSCFILDDGGVIIQCLSFILESSIASLTPSIIPTVDQQQDVYTNDIRNDIPNNNAEGYSTGFGPFTDAAFITMVVVSGIVIISCLVCGLICFSKYQKEKVRKEWYKERELNKNKHRKSISTIKIPKNPAEPSFVDSVVHTAYDSDLDSTICKSRSRYSRKIHSASYPAITTNAMLRPPPPPGPPPNASYTYNGKPNRSRKTKITHRTLYKFPDEGEMSDTSDDITPLGRNNQRKRFVYTNRTTNSVLSNTSSMDSNMSRFPRTPSTSFGYDYFEAESSGSSETLVFKSNEKQLQTSCMLTRPSKSVPDNMSTLSRRSVDVTEDEQKYVAASGPIETAYIPYRSELTKQLKLRKRPKITRRCTDSDDEWDDHEAYTYHNVNINDQDAQSEDEDNLRIIYSI